MDAGSLTTALHSQPVNLVNRKKDLTSVPLETSKHKKTSSFAATLTSAIVDDEGYINLDGFIANMEARLNTLAGYGLDSLASPIDSSIDPRELVRIYSRMVSFKNSLVSGGIEKAENFLIKLETHYNDFYDAVSKTASEVTALDEFSKDLTVDSPVLRARSNSDSETLPQDSSISDSTSVAEKAVNGLRYIESKLSDLEALCLESVSQAETLNKSIQAAIVAAKNRLLTYDELPQPWRHNPYIRRGYRFCEKYTSCAVSVVTLHNETCNIWTHLLGFVVMIFIAFFHYPTTLSWTNSNWSDKLTMITFLLAAAKCLFCSTIWHTCNGISHAGQVQRWACLDYTGITVLIAASIITTEYCAFYCSPKTQLSYITITALFGLGGAILTWHPSFDNPGAKNKRIVFFVSFATAGITGFIHASMIYGLADTFNFYAPVFKSLCFYGFGVFFYAFFFPERYISLKFLDYFGMSHNIWHICVFGGIYFHYTAAVKLLENAREFTGCPI